jgi:hypothetical protein
VTARAARDRVVAIIRRSDGTRSTPARMFDCMSTRSACARETAEWY